MREPGMVGAVDIGGTKIAVGVVDGGGRVLARRAFPTREVPGFDGAMDRIASLLAACREEAQGALLGLGIGCRGPVDPFTGEVGVVAFLEGWQGRNPPEELGRRLGVGAALENDADAAALGEVRWGAGRDDRTVICITVGTGIGGGIVRDGRLYRGVERAHPELGHHVIDPAGPRCFCGADGCWEMMASGTAMAAWYQAQAPGAGGREGPSARRIFELAEAGEDLAVRAVAREAFYLALGVANLVTLFAPDRIVLGGSILSRPERFLPAIHARVAPGRGLVPSGRIRIVPASLGPDAGLIGAGAVWHHRAAPGQG